MEKWQGSKQSFHWNPARIRALWFPLGWEKSASASASACSWPAASQELDLSSRSSASPDIANTSFPSALRAELRRHLPSDYCSFTAYCTKYREQIFAWVDNVFGSRSLGRLFRIPSFGGNLKEKQNSSRSVRISPSTGSAGCGIVESSAKTGVRTIIPAPACFREKSAISLGRSRGSHKTQSKR